MYKSITILLKMNNSGTSSTNERYYGMSIAYYGTDFIGWQRQPAASKPGFFSVQQIIEDSLSRALSKSERVNVNAVSRTDAGTHAVAVSNLLLSASPY
uniref:tRNA pseudouridine synthase A putative n=1 Tax=Albugo laibachii Nc14 TaxID=890382 RepID=F0W5T8_9STRA|nr:tRNA pseudouridine synthase A putative [Albugo laibachii Nc14]|eukprot:CCA16479.1 tRNA pseudouridine synthase A putative [Albugo laibachii Nc14]